MLITATITQNQGNNIEKNSPFIPKSILCVTTSLYLFETAHLFFTIYNALNEHLKNTPMACGGGGGGGGMCFQWKQMHNE